MALKEFQPLAFRLPCDEYDVLQRIRAASGASLSEVVRQLLRPAMADALRAIEQHKHPFAVLRHGGRVTTDTDREATP